MRLIIIAGFLVSLSTLFSFAEVKQDVQDAKVSESRPERVSMVQLIANPEKYDGKEIVLIGFVTLGFENNAIYLEKSDYEYSDPKNSFYLSGTDEMSRTLGKNFKGFCMLQGTFEPVSDKEGWRTARSGVIKNITRFVKWNGGRPR